MRVNFFATYRSLSGSRSTEIACPPGSTVMAVIQLVLVQYPLLKEHWLNRQGEIQAHLTVVLNKVDVNSLPQGLNTPVSAEDVLDFVPPVGGG